jgi:hypothetical protein
MDSGDADIIDANSIDTNSIDTNSTKDKALIYKLKKENYYMNMHLDILGVQVV